MGYLLSASACIACQYIIENRKVIVSTRICGRVIKNEADDRARRGLYNGPLSVHHTFPNHLGKASLFNKMCYLILTHLHEYFHPFNRRGEDTRTEAREHSGEDGGRPARTVARGEEECL